ncbi:unnamed protein product [Citrullus colocynthis]|uniref:Uncharacterized protein n=1 Tax=Citrullus colocynthis TaxID=252529 RepID=A0ABP0YYT2_9ROSI
MESNYANAVLSRLYSNARDSRTGLSSTAYQSKLPSSTSGSDEVTSSAYARVQSNTHLLPLQCFELTPQHLLHFLSIGFSVRFP